jgi:SAM-dependent methyltransferase
MPVETTLDASSLERIIPEQLDTDGATGQATLELHMERYRFAAAHMRPGALLDIACGVGYGSAFLKTRCPQIHAATGVDLSLSAIAYAREHYKNSGVQFIQANAMEFSAAEGFTNIVSLETIEHLPDPRIFVRRIATMLRPGGVLIGSVPVTPSMDGNPHHLTDFSESSFRRLLDGCGLEEIAALRQIQPFSALDILGAKEKRVSRDHPGLIEFYCIHPVKLLLRIGATLRYGFQNRYLTLAWTKRA